ncbi:CU044_5270 family protein [Streptomyces sp. NPDC051217]|uniref:CU044_5270 family protein n=1 Tax=Streptomyces sp. NPDC051217 TaxID=3365644 RepID=UPI0037A38FB5
MNVFPRRSAGSTHAPASGHVPDGGALSEAQAGPSAPDVPDLPVGRQSLLKEHFMQSITKHPATRETVDAPVPHGSWRRRTALVLAPALAVAAVVTAAGLGGFFSQGGAGGSSAATAAEHQEAAGLLDRIANVAAQGDSGKVADSQYVYTHVKGRQRTFQDGKIQTATVPYEREDWHAVDGSRHGLAVQKVGPGAGVPEGPQRMTLDSDPNYTTYRELAALPTEPGALLDKIYADTKGQGPTQAQAAFEAIGSMLDEALVVPDVDAALYRAAARIPGVVVQQDAVDGAGRQGIGLTLKGAHGDRTSWVFDPVRLTYLGTNEVALIQVGIVDKVEQRP